VQRLVAIGFARPATGLERVMARVLDALARDFQVHWLGLGYQGDVAHRGNVTLHPSNLRGGDAWGVTGGRELAEDLGADVVLVYNDLWLLEKYKCEFDGPRVVAYCPLDGRILGPALVDMVSWVDDLVVFSEFARLEFERFGVAPVHVIGHGVDDVAFHPMAGEEARASALPRGWRDAFVVLNANRLQPRKRIDITLDAFASFAARRPDARLYLHHALEGLGDEEAFDAQLGSLGLGSRVHVNRRPLSDDELNVLYNACNIGLNTAMGEAWGLVSFEHALTGAAQVVPRHSACEELWDRAAELVEPARWLTPSFSYLEMGEAAAEDVAATLSRLYDDRDHLKEMSAAALARASEPRFSWKAAGAQWRDLLASGR
jgi:glycosyltransferase involved in cell wall biosynthesis